MMMMNRVEVEANKGKEESGLPIFTLSKGGTFTPPPPCLFKGYFHSLFINFEIITLSSVQPFTSSECNKTVVLLSV